MRTSRPPAAHSRLIQRFLNTLARSDGLDVGRVGIHAGGHSTVKMRECGLIATKYDVFLCATVKALLRPLSNWKIFVLDHMYDEIEIVVPMATGAFT